MLRQYDLLDVQPDGRVSSVPDSRTVRYYTTIGLLERPVLEGRQAFYTHRHVLQLLSIKALQAHHLPLSEIQSRLYGKTERELESMLSALSQQRPREELGRPIVWREFTIEPGLKLLAEENWSSISASDLEQRVREAVNQLLTTDKKRRQQQ